MYVNRMLKNRIIHFILTEGICHCQQFDCNCPWYSVGFSLHCTRSCFTAACHWDHQSHVQHRTPHMQQYVSKEYLRSTFNSGIKGAARGNQTCTGTRVHSWGNRLGATMAEHWHCHWNEALSVQNQIFKNITEINARHIMSPASASAQRPQQGNCSSGRRGPSTQHLGIQLIQRYGFCAGMPITAPTIHHAWKWGIFGGYFSAPLR